MWKPMRVRSGDGGSGGALPGERGRYVIWLEPPLVDGQGHYVHFSWVGESFCIRDYIMARERRQDRATRASDVWEAAGDRIPCKGELFVPIENFEFWSEKLLEFTQGKRAGKERTVWSRLSSRIAKVAGSPASPPKRNSVVHPDDHYQRLRELWGADPGYEVIDRTVGCSLRRLGEPLLWAYPTRFQAAPAGKGGRHYEQVVDIVHRHFPEIRGKSGMEFDSQFFTWERLEAVVTDIKALIEEENRDEEN